MTVSGPTGDELVLEFRLGGAARHSLRRFRFPAEADRRSGVEMMGRDQQRLERRSPPCVAAVGQRPERVAVIALPARDDAPALRLAHFDGILSRHLERGFDGFRSAD